MYAQPAFLPWDKQVEVRLSVEQAQSLNKSLNALAEQSRVSFVVEGRPFHATLSQERARNISGEMPFDIALGKVATAYDYDTIQQGDVYVLKKRYSDPKDLPSVTIEECRLTLQDMVRAVSSVTPDIPPQRDPNWDPATSPLMASLTDRQLRRISGSIVDGSIISPLPTANALPVSTLASEQQALVRQLALNLFLQFRVDDGKSVLKEYEMLVRDNPVFCWRKESGKRLFGYETVVNRPSSQKTTYFWPLSGSTPLSTVQGGLVGDIRSIGFLSASPTMPTAMSPDPAEASATVTVALTEESAEIWTLAEAVETLNRRALGLRMKVEEALASKSIILSGEANVSPLKIFRALAEVYDLRIKTEKDGTLVLTRRRIKAINNIVGLPDVMHSALPQPLYRAFHCDASDMPFAVFVPANEEQPSKRTRQGDQQVSGADGGKKRSRPVERSTVMAEAAAQRLQTLIEPKAKRMPNQRISLSALGSEEQSVLALLVMAQNWSKIRGLIIRSLSASLTKFDQLYLVGGLYEEEGKTKFALFLSLLGEDGKIHVTGEGVSDVGYVKPPK